MDGGGRRKRRSRGRETECFHLVANPVRLPPPDGTHRPPSPTPPPAASAASSECGRVKACITGRQRERGDSRRSVCVCVCEMSQQWMSLRQPPQPLRLPSRSPSQRYPGHEGAHPGCSVQDDPLRGRDSWWRLQPAELRLDTGRTKQSVNCQINSRRKRKKKREKKPCKKYKPTLSCWGFI